MSKSQTRVLSILQKYTYNKTLLEDANEESHIIKDLKINSARIVDIVLDIEEEFSVEITNKMLESINTIGDLVNIIENK